MRRPNVHRLWRIFLVSVAFCVTGGNWTVWAGGIVIGNASFEDPELGEGGSTAVMTDWSLIGENFDQGIFVNDGDAGYGGIINNVDGNQASFIIGYKKAGYYQATNTMFQAGQGYRITAAVGLQTDSELNGGNLSLEILAGNVAVATTTIAFNDKNLKKGTLTDYSVFLPDGKNVAGKILTFQVVSDGNATKGNWIVDNIRGDIITPEPSCLILAAQGAILVCFGLWRVRGQQRGRS